MILTILCVTQESLSQCSVMIPRQPEDWGKGLLYFVDKDSVPLRYRDNEVAGYLVRDGWYLNVKSSSNELVKQFERVDIIQAGHTNLLYLKAFDTIEHRYLVLKNSYDFDLFLLKSDLRNGSRFLTYRQMLLLDDNNPKEVNHLLKIGNIGINETKYCMNLREEPNTESEIINCIESFKRESYTHFDIIESKGDWALVNAKKYDRYEIKEDGSNYHECPYELVSEQKGWINIIDPKGFPNLWFSITSY